MQSDVPNLLKNIEEYLEATEKARGSAKKLHTLAPLELDLYNIATRTSSALKALRAGIEDFQGTYLKGDNHGEN